MGSVVIYILIFLSSSALWMIVFSSSYYFEDNTLLRALTSPTKNTFSVSKQVYSIK